MQVRGHKLEGVEYKAARLIGPTIVPEVVVLHDTAGRAARFSSRDYLATTTKASVHFVVEVDGTISQLVPTNRRAGHAGQSSWQGRRDVNGFSIGIEIVNPGRMTPLGNGFGLTWWGEQLDHAVEVETPEHGKGAWAPYPEAQIAAVRALLEVLFRDVRTLKDITTHWYISPGRKVDTNPLFPLESLRARILGRDDPALTEAEIKSTPVEGDRFLRIKVPGSTLNIRRWPSFNPNVIAAAPDGAELPHLRSGTFDGRLWHQVMFDGREGWVVARYTEAA
jgi:N-acetylmuramoyl-L-alanine amidase